MECRGLCICNRERARHGMQRCSRVLHPVFKHVHLIDRAPVPRILGKLASRYNTNEVQCMGVRPMAGAPLPLWRSGAGAPPAASAAPGHRPPPPRPSHSARGRARWSLRWGSSQSASVPRNPRPPAMNGRGSEGRAVSKEGTAGCGMDCALSYCYYAANRWF